MKKQQPLVSFILTYYNLPVQMLCECIDSILALSLTPEEREIIVVDDGSEVSPMNGLMHYGDDIIYVRQHNQGLSMARNKGIDMATGTYLQFVDADDYLLTDPYNYCLDVLRQNGDRTDMVIFDFTTDNNDQSDYGNPLTISGTEYLRHHNIRGTAWGYLFRSKTLSELRFTPGIYHEDEEFTPQLLIRSEQVCIVAAKVYFYRKRKDSIMTDAHQNKCKKRLDDSRDVILRLHYLADRMPQNERLAMQRRVAQLSMDYIYNIILQTRSADELNSRLDTLRLQGLFPLPDRDYSQKYKWFRRMINTAAGRQLLLHTLPYIKRER